jgi:hypothetical protein
MLMPRPIPSPISGTGASSGWRLKCYTKERAQAWRKDIGIAVGRVCPCPRRANRMHLETPTPLIHHRRRFLPDLIPNHPTVYRACKKSK